MSTNDAPGAASPVTLQHPAFAPYRELIDELGLEQRLPDIDTLNRIAEARKIVQGHGLPLQFFVPDQRLCARAYETSVLETGRVPTRADNWHDTLNALVWLRFPRFKSALNLAHGEAMADEVDTRRGRRRDALTVLDESGVWVVSGDATLPAMLEAHAWQALFRDARARVIEAMRFVVVGHALLEKALAPFPSMTGKCLTLLTPSLAVDDAEGLAADAVVRLATPRELAPLPIQGVPGWDVKNAADDYYADTRVFRPIRV